MNVKLVTKVLEGHEVAMSRLALKFIEAEARKFLREHNNYNEFLMAMGQWFFTDKKGNVVDNERLPISANVLRDFIEEWDERLKLTGAPMRFTASGKMRRDW